jgi:hypothetical protein
MDALGLAALWYCDQVTLFGALTIFAFYNIFTFDNGEQRYGLRDIYQLLLARKGCALNGDVVINKDLMAFVKASARKCNEQQQKEE